MVNNKDKPTGTPSFPIKEQVRQNGNYMQLDNSRVSKKQSTETTTRLKIRDLKILYNR